MTQLIKTEYQPGDGTKYGILLGTATAEPGEPPGRFVACMFGNTGTAAVLGPAGNGGFLAWTYLKEKLQCREPTARAVAHFINLRECPDYLASLESPDGPMNQESLIAHLPECLARFGERKRTREELLAVAADKTHGVTYAETPWF